MGTFQRYPDAGALYIQPCSRPQMCLILSYAYNKGLGGSPVESRDVLNPDTPVSPGLAAASLSLRTDHLTRLGPSPWDDVLFHDCPTSPGPGDLTRPLT